MPWIPSQTKIRCKLAIARIRTVIEKNESLAKRSRREVASLIEVGKIETARIRTESLIQQDAHNELLELLELYLELILARFGLLEMSSKEKEPDEGVREAVYAVVYASPRTEVRELHIIREAFMSRYGRDWAIKVTTNEGGNTISPRILSKTSSETPSKELVDLYLYEIAKAYGLGWRPEGLLEGLNSDKDGVEDTNTVKLAQEDAQTASGSDVTNSSEKPGGGGDLDLPSAPASAPHLTNVKNSTSAIPMIQSLKELGDDTLPAPPPIDPSNAARTVVIKSNLGSSPNASSGKDLDTQPVKGSFDDLAKRFEALKRK